MVGGGVAVTLIGSWSDALCWCVTVPVLDSEAPKLTTKQRTRDHHFTSTFDELDLLWSKDKIGQQFIQIGQNKELYPG